MSNEKYIILLLGVLVVVITAEDSPTPRLFGSFNLNVTSKFCNYFCGNSASATRSSKTFQLCSTKCPSKSNINNTSQSTSSGAVQASNASLGLVQVSNASPGLVQTTSAFPGLVQTSNAVPGLVQGTVVTSNIPTSMTFLVMNLTGVAPVSSANRTLLPSSQLIFGGNESDSLEDLLSLSLEEGEIL